MVDISFYLVSREIAVRCELIGQRYVAQDGRFILDNKDLSRLRLTSEEYVNGISNIEMITKKEAEDLIKENKYTFGE